MQIAGPSGNRAIGRRAHMWIAEPPGNPTPTELRGNLDLGLNFDATHPLTKFLQTPSYLLITCHTTPTPLGYQIFRFCVVGLHSALQQKAILEPLNALFWRIVLHMLFSWPVGAGVGPN
jgi:hypothetical protein